MYLNFYRLIREPFQVTPDPEFLYLSPSHKEALASIIYGVEQRKGFIAIVGEVGVGKTTIVRSYLEGFGGQQLKIIYLFNANTSFDRLLKLICQDLGIRGGTDDAFGLVHEIHKFLIDQYEKGNNVVLIIDEAQNMPLETLENLRMLSNLETSAQKLIQIVLIGPPELEQRLALRVLRQLKQRIAVRATISALTGKECLEYIQHRLRKASADGAAIFSKGALRGVIRKSKGIPRAINILCDNALVTGFGYQKRRITRQIVQEVIADLEGKPKVSFLRRLFALFSLFSFLSSC